jgi:hypothetical protein
MPQPEILVHLVTTRDQLRELLRGFAEEMRPAPEPELKKTLSLEEAAALSRVSKGTFRHWAKTGLVTPLGAGKIKFYDSKEVINLLNSKKK